MIRILKNNFWAIIFACLVGLIYFLPNILMPYFLNQYSGGEYCAICNTDEGFAYISRVQEVLDGHWFEGDAYLAEYKNMPGIWGTNFMVMIIGAFMKIFNIKSVTSIFLYGDFVFPMLGYFAAYFLFLKIIRNKLFSYLSAFVFLCFPNFFIYKKFLELGFYKNISWLNILSVLENSFNSYYSRLFIPAFSFIFFIAFLLFLYSIINDKRPKKFLLPAIFFFGSLFYVYFYYWVFATIALAILFTFLFYKYRKNAFNILRVLIGGYLISIPFWIKLWILKQSPIYSELSGRTGIELSRAFKMDSLDTFIFIIFMVFLLYFLGKKLKQIKTSHYLNALLLTIIIVLNLQVILGFNIQIDHWGSRINVYILALGLLVLIFWLIQYLFKKINSKALFWSKIVFNLLIIFSMILFPVLALSSQINISSVNAYENTMPDYMTDAFNWINKNTPKDSVFIALSTTSNYDLPIFTHANVYNPPACRSLAGEKEIIHRFLESYHLFNVSLVKFSKVISSDTNKDLELLYDAELGDFLFCGKYHNQDTSHAIPDAVREDLFLQYELFRKLKASPRNLKYRADYLFLGPRDALISNLNIKKYKNLTLIFSNNFVKIYKL